MNKTIFLYATLPKKGHVPYGGGEVGNMRTIRMLEEAGYKVITMRQRKAKAGWGTFRKLATYPFRLIIGWIEVISKLFFASRKSLVHLSGFAGVTILNEYVLMHIIKLFGFSVLYELRGGGAIGFWENGSSMYRSMFRYLLKSSCYIFVQGKENIPMVKSICQIPVYHYANCVEDGFAPDTFPVKPLDKINLLFYGRLEYNKHVDMIVETAALVQDQIPNVYLTIVGNGQQAYLDIVKAKMKKLLKAGSYCYQSGCKHEELPKLLMDKHFYIFPSTQPREGQSNSVTECMSYGIVPIASRHGFNRSTIGDDNLIVDKLTSEEYSNRIINIIRSGKFDKYSKIVYSQFQNNYTQKVVFDKTLKVYEEIMKI